MAEEHVYGCNATLGADGDSVRSCALTSTGWVCLGRLIKAHRPMNEHHSSTDTRLFSVFSFHLISFRFIAFFFLVRRVEQPRRRIVRFPAAAATTTTTATSRRRRRLARVSPTLHLFAVEQCCRDHVIVDACATNGSSLLRRRRGTSRLLRRYLRQEP